MTHAVAAPSRTDTASGGRLIHLLVTLVLGATCCATALAATSPITACDRTADLDSLEVPVSELSASVVGHIVVVPGEDDEVLDVLPTQGDSAEPILNLAPRVAEILQDVFSAVAIETAPTDADQSIPSYSLEPAPKDESPLSPVAGDAGQSEPSELADPDSVIDGANAVPGVQRRMFRTDI